MQLKLMHKPLKLLILVAGFTLLFMMASTLYIREINYPQPDEMLCIWMVFYIPQKQISYGFPMFWLTYTEGIKQYGCGPVVGSFSTYSIAWQEFLIDFAFYAFCCSLILYSMKRTRHNPKPVSPNNATAHNALSSSPCPR